MSDRVPPEPFELLEASTFLVQIGPLFLDRTASPPRFGAYVTERHLNTMGGAHGGFLSALADVAAGGGARLLLDDGRALRTVSMTVDFVAGATSGDWLEAEVAVDRAGRRTVFVSCRIRCGDRLVARASVILG